MHVLFQKVFNGIAAEVSAADGWKQRVCRSAVSFPKPSSHNDHGILSKWRATLLASLALASDMRAAAESNVLAAKSHELRDSQP
jgi:hypothetical protein